MHYLKFLLFSSALGTVAVNENDKNNSIWYCNNLSKYCWLINIGQDIFWDNMKQGVIYRECRYILETFFTNLVSMVIKFDLLSMLTPKNTHLSLILSFIFP